MLNEIESDAIISPMQIFVYRIIAHFYIIFMFMNNKIITSMYVIRIITSIFLVYEIQSSHSNSNEQKNGAKFAICTTKMSITKGQFMCVQL